MTSRISAPQVSMRTHLGRRKGLHIALAHVQQERCADQAPLTLKNARSARIALWAVQPAFHALQELMAKSKG